MMLNHVSCECFPLFNCSPPSCKGFFSKRLLSLTLWSSSLVHGPLMSSGLRTFCHLCWHCTSVRFCWSGSRALALTLRGGHIYIYTRVHRPHDLQSVGSQSLSSLLIHGAQPVSLTSHPERKHVAVRRMSLLRAAINTM